MKPQFLIVVIPIILLGTWAISQTIEALTIPENVLCMDEIIVIIYDEILPSNVIKYDESMKTKLLDWAERCEDRTPFNTYAFMIRVKQSGYIEEFTLKPTPIYQFDPSVLQNATNVSEDNQ